MRCDILNQNFDPACLQLIPLSRLQSIKERHRKEAESLFLEAKRATIASRPVIPPWFIVLTVALGWNEFLTILRNPMLTILFLLALGISYFVWKTNMTGPVFQIAKATAFEIGNQTKEALKEKGVDMNEIHDRISAKLSAALNQIHTPRKNEQNIEMTQMKESDKNK
jgi:hypothetical protein